MTIVVDGTRGRSVAERLASLDLSEEQIERALLRADAEARLVTTLEPPNAEGQTRYMKGTGYFREEVVPAGWVSDNARNFCRTVHPSGHFAVVVSSGDERTGVWVAGQKPSTKYTKGETTVRVVKANAQIALSLGSQFDVRDESEVAEVVWYLLYRSDGDRVFAELSLPSAIEGGVIVDWHERIILGPFDATPDAVDGPVLGLGDNGTGHDYTVDVEMRGGE